MTNRVQYDPQPTPPTALAAKKRRKPRRRYPDGTLRHRLQKTFGQRRPWWDWGHRVMTLVGRWDGTGHYSIPRGRDMWYYETGRGKFHTTFDYSEVRLYQWGDRAWKVFDIQNDGFELHMGYWPEPGSNGNITFYDLNRHELKLFRHWDFWECRVRAEWFGLRRWIYYKALRAAVNQKRPFACNFTPPKGAGGYNHWHCQLKPSHRRKGEPHRFNNYTFPLTAAPKPGGK